MVKQFLNDLDVLAFLAQKTSDRVAEGVPADGFRDPRIDRRRANVIPKRGVGPI
jgi:hypothetical protein